MLPAAALPTRSVPTKNRLNSISARPRAVIESAPPRTMARPAVSGRTVAVPVAVNVDDESISRLSEIRVMFGAFVSPPLCRTPKESSPNPARPVATNGPAVALTVAVLNSTPSFDPTGPLPPVPSRITPPAPPAVTTVLKRKTPMLMPSTSVAPVPPVPVMRMVPVVDVRFVNAITPLLKPPAPPTPTRVRSPLETSEPSMLMPGLLPLKPWPPVPLTVIVLAAVTVPTTDTPASKPPPSVPPTPMSATLPPLDTSDWRSKPMAVLAAVPERRMLPPAAVFNVAWTVSPSFDSASSDTPLFARLTASRKLIDKLARSVTSRSDELSADGSML